MERIFAKALPGGNREFTRLLARPRPPLSAPPRAAPAPAAPPSQSPCMASRGALTFRVLVADAAHTVTLTPDSTVADLKRVVRGPPTRPCCSPHRGMRDARVLCAREGATSSPVCASPIVISRPLTATVGIRPTRAGCDGEVPADHICRAYTCK